MKKRIFAVVAMLCVAVAGHGQYFEWAKGFASQQSDNAIVGTVADSAGNLYILANFRNDAVWDDSLRLLPIAPYGPAHNNINTMIAKMTPDGNIAWRKVVHANNGADSYAWDIKMIGDTSFAVTLSTRMPSWESEYLYWLDTLVAGVSDYPVPQGNMAETSISAFVVFGFDGTVKEQHFLRMTAIDNDGYDIYFMHSLQEGLFPLYLSELKFDVDGDGNIYICYPMHYITDSAYSATLGTITAVKIWVDQHVVGIIDVDTLDKFGLPSLLKLSPHLDCLLDTKKLVQKSRLDYYSCINGIYLDKRRNVYIYGVLRPTLLESNIVFFDTLNNISISQTNINTDIGYLLKCDSNLLPTKCIHLKDSVANNGNLTSSRPFFRDVYFCEDDSLLLISGFVQKNQNANSVYFIDNHVIDFEKNDAFIMVLDVDSLSLVEHIIVPSLRSSHLGGIRANGNLYAKNNRIFMQCMYYRGLNLPNGTLRLTNQNYPETCLLIYDYQGELINCINYNSRSENNIPRSINLVDSILYLTNSLATDASFGDHILQNQGYTQSIAKYVDTTFLTQYHRPEASIEVFNHDSITIYPNPSHDVIFITGLGSRLSETYVVNLAGRRIKMKPTYGSIDISFLAQGVYFLEIVTENDKYTTKFIKI